MSTSLQGEPLTAGVPANTVMRVAIAACGKQTGIAAKVRWNYFGSLAFNA